MELVGSDEAGGKGLPEPRTELPADLPGLVVLAQAGDPGAFETIVRACQGRVLRFALKLLRDPEDARDAAQEVLVRFYKYLPSLDPRRDPFPWLMQMTLNVCRDTARRRAQTAHLSIHDPAFPEPAAEGHGTDSAVEHLHAARETRRVLSALEKLPRREHDVLLLRDLEGLSFAEVARLLDSTETTVRSQACRARLKLRKLLEHAWRPKP
jgi:RNA polymerase sigma-70 factor, ECF subfamily